MELYDLNLGLFTKLIPVPATLHFLPDKNILSVVNELRLWEAGEILYLSRMSSKI